MFRVVKQSEAKSLFRHFVNVSVCLSHDYGYTPLPIVMRFGTSVLGTKTERRVCQDIFCPSSFNKAVAFFGHSSHQRIL